jgi:type IV pilus assembly protein PilO
MASDKKASKLNAFIDTKYIPLDNKVKLAILIALIVLPLGLFYFLSYTKNIEIIEKLNKQRVTLQTDIAKAKKAASELDKMKAEKKETEAKFQETATVLPKGKEIPRLLTNISDLGKRAALDFNSFRPGAEIPKDFYAEIPVNIQIKGPYHNLGYFLDKISKLFTGIQQAQPK